MELTSAPAAPPGPGPAPAGGSADAPALHGLGLERGTEAPELMVPRSDVFSSNWDGGSDKEDFPRGADWKMFGEGQGEGCPSGVESFGKTEFWR